MYETKHKEAHVIVVGNEKGGCGKSTISMHLAIALLKKGQRVAIIDIDSRQKSISQYIQNRAQYKRQFNLDIKMPTLITIERSSPFHTSKNIESELNHFVEAISSLEENHDFIIIDTPASDTYLMRMSHALCDTLVTPINESFIDIDVLGKLNPDNYEVLSTSQYSEIVREARANRRKIDNGVIDWIVLLNRRSPSQTQNARHLQKAMIQLSALVGFRTSMGLTERLVYREFFPNGLTALDDVSTIGTRYASKAQIAAKFEVEEMINKLRLPIDSKGKRRIEALEIWQEQKDKGFSYNTALFS